MKTLITSKLRFTKLDALTLLALAVLPMAFTTKAADISWTGATASYTNAANWTGSVVPGATDTAINDNGTNNKVQINAGNPDWTLNRLRAGNSTGDGAFEHNAQTLFITNSPRTLGIGVASGRTGVYSLNGGAINYGGEFDVGILGTGILNISGGTILGSGTLAVNVGTSLDGVNATIDGGTNKTGFTWFEQGFYTPDPSRGLPASGSTFFSVSDANYSYTMAPSYAGTGSMLLSSGVPTGTMTLTSPTACTALSLLGSAGNGATTVNYTVHHADSTTEVGSIVVLDWFATNAPAWYAGGRVPANGLGFQIISAPNYPCLFSLDLTLTNTTSAVTSVDLSFGSGGVACLLALSGSSGGLFNPLAITGYNADMIFEAGAPIYVSGAVTDILNQSGGTIDITGEFWVGNYGNGAYNLSGGTNNFRNWFALGRSGGNGTMNMTGGELNKSGNGDFLVGTGFQAPAGSTPTGIFNHSGGTITSGNSVLVPENGPAVGTYNMNSAAVLNINNWLAVGRNGGTGELNLTNGVINKAGAGNIVVGASGPGTLNQYGGSITNTATQTWLGENSGGTWNLYGGSATLGIIHIAQTPTSAGTLNVIGGVLRASEITAGDIFGSSFLNLNGGTIQPTADSTAFIHNLSAVYVSAGGAIFDTTGFNVTIPQALLDSGGSLTKNGAGTLTLTGANGYTGTNMVNAGKLITSTASTGGGDITVANGAVGLGVLVVGSLNSQLNAASATLPSSAIALDFDLGSFGNPTLAPLNVIGALAVNGTVTVNIADALPQLGQFPLIKYGSMTGAGSFVLGSTPFGVVASISNNVANSSIDLVVTSVNAPRWEGQAGGNWDISVTTNWINLGDNLPTFYTDGSAVILDDTATGTTTVNLVTTVHPQSITINNTNLSYTLIGSGKISGSIGLNKQGSGTLSILNTGGNDYTRPTVITAGTLSVTNLANGGLASPIGASSADPTNLVFAGGTFSYAGSPVSVNRGYKVTTTGSAIETVSNLTLSGVARGPSGTTFNKTGLGQLAYTAVTSSNALVDPAVAGGTYLIKAGTVLLDGSAGPQTNFSRNLNVGSDAGVNPTLILTNTTLFTRLTLGNNANCTGTMILHSNTFLKVLGGGGNFVVGGQSSGVGSPTAGVLTQNAGSTIDSDAELWDGQGLAGVGTFNMNAGTTTIRNWVAIGRGGATGTFNMTGGTFNKGGGGQFIIGTGAGNNTITSFGTLNQSGGTINCTNEYWIGENALDTGTNNISGSAVVNWMNWVSIGRRGKGVVNFSGGTITRTGGGSAIVVGDNVGGPGNGFFSQSGGTLTSANELWIGQGSGSTGRYDLSGTGVVTVNNWVAIGRGGAASGTLNMSGGSFTKTGNGGNHLLIGTGGPGTINQTGGTITSVLSDTYVGDTSTGIWIIDGGSANMSVVHISQNSGVFGTLNLNTNGTVTATEVTTGNAGGRSTLNFNGGKLIAANGANANFLHDLSTNNVQSGGAIIDSGTNTINISQALLDGTGGGGLTKLGTGTLRLNGVNTYTGTTLVNAGTLGGSGTIAGPVSVASGATLAPGLSLGTLTISNALTLAAGSTNVMELSKNAGTNDLITGASSIAYGGTLVLKNLGGMLAVNDTFKLFNAGSYSGPFSGVVSQTPGQTVAWDTSNLTVDGTVRAATVVNVPVSLTSTVGGGNLNFSWPELGWRLEVQTNSLTVGINTNWFTVPGSTNVTAASVPIVPGNPTVFYRLVFP